MKINKIIFNINSSNERYTKLTDEEIMNYESDVLDNLTVDEIFGWLDECDLGIHLSRNNKIYIPESNLDDSEYISNHTSIDDILSKYGLYWNDNLNGLEFTDLYLLKNQFNLVGIESSIVDKYKNELSNNPKLKDSDDYANVIEYYYNIYDLRGKYDFDFEFEVSNNFISDIEKLIK